MRLPKTLTVTTLRCAVLGTLACNAQVAEGTDGGPSDAALDFAAHDSPTACDGAISLCGAGPCPNQGAYYCTDQCPPGCEPFA
jgi:hypothetical protein